MYNKDRPNWLQIDKDRQKTNTCCMGLYAGVDYNLTLRLLQCRLQHIYHGPPDARVDFNPML
jgi:hypothetical protein